MELPNRDSLEAWSQMMPPVSLKRIASENRRDIPVHPKMAANVLQRGVALSAHHPRALLMFPALREWVKKFMSKHPRRKGENVDDWAHRIAEEALGIWCGCIRIDVV